jgi:hypothetical protein
MKKMDWMKLTTPEIKIKQMTLEREYDSIKIEINKLLTKLSELDEEYMKAENELQKRNKK